MQGRKPKIAGDVADPRFQRSLDALIEAITTLAEAEPLPSISITRLTDAAGVSRPTFYQHAKDVPDLARRAALRRLRGALQVPPDFTEMGKQSFEQVRQAIDERLVRILQHLAQNRKFYLNVLENGGSPDMYAQVVSMLTMHVNIDPFFKHMAPGMGAPGALTEVIMGGLMWRVVGWMRSDAATLDPAAMGRETAVLSATLLCGLSALRTTAP